MFKFVVLLVILSLTSAHHEAEDGGHGHHEDHFGHAKYNFEYGVKDGHTGDHKSQWEHGDGHHVNGGYTLDEADGTKRVVEYTSDKHGGLIAHVKRIGHAHHPAVYGHHGDHGHEHGHGGSSYANFNLYHHHH